MMRDYPLNDTGFLITSETAVWINLAYDRKTENVPPDIQELLDQGLFRAAARDGSNVLSELDYDTVESAQECLEGMGINTVYCSEFTGQAKPLELPEGNPFQEETEYEGEPLCYIPVKRAPELFKAAYNSSQEMIDEFMSELADVFPEDFDIRKFLVTISGTYFC